MQVTRRCYFQRPMIFRQIGQFKLIMDRHAFTSRTTLKPMLLVHFDTICLLSSMPATSRTPLVWLQEILEYIAAIFVRRSSFGSIATILNSEPNVYKKSRAAMHVHCGRVSKPLQCWLMQNKPTTPTGPSPSIAIVRPLASGCRCLVSPVARMEL